MNRKRALEQLLWAAVGDVGAIRDHLASAGGMSQTEHAAMQYRAKRADERVRMAIELMQEDEPR